MGEQDLRGIREALDGGVRLHPAESLRLLDRLEAAEQAVMCAADTFSVVVLDSGCSPLRDAWCETHAAAIALARNGQQQDNRAPSEA